MKRIEYRIVSHAHARGAYPPKAILDDVILVCFMKGYANLYFHIPLLVKLGFRNLLASN